MSRILIAGFLAAIVLFIWGMAAWMVVPLHTPTIAGLPNEAEITKLLKDQNLQTGVYLAPWSDNEADWSNPESAWMKNHLAGPLYSIYYQKEGAAPMNAGVLLGGFIINLLSALLAAWLLSCAAAGSCSSYWQRVGFSAGLGILVGLFGHGNFWNWGHFPADYTFAFIIDDLVGWTLAGLVLAGLVRPAPAATP
ncbi:MAG: hypothetical protein KatS3mg105_4153 [Gemmatales bacterium]|nr:MAG: hypothetical protein KatS3mg105_4153 [Gemmatales bacterium]